MRKDGSNNDTTEAEVWAMSLKSKDTMKLNVEVSICRYSGGRDGSGWRIEITDCLSGHRIVEVDLTHAQFAQCIGSNSNGNGKIYNSPYYGMKAEHKLVEMPYDGKYGDENDLEAIYDAAESENDGWKASRGGWNGHLYKDKTYRVTLRRYVEAPQ
jgi:hypothetical protein